MRAFVCGAHLQTETGRCSQNTLTTILSSRSNSHTITACLVQVYGNAAALFDALDAFLLGGRLQVRTVQSKSHGGKTLRLAK